MVDKYTWVDIGSSYILSDILAAVLYAQLEQKDLIQNKRKAIWTRYFTSLQNWADNQGIQLPYVPSHCEQTYHMFYIVLPSLKIRQTLIQYLREKGVVSVFHYQPLHLSDMGKQFGGKLGDLPVTERMGDCLLRLPFYNALSETDQDQVIDILTGFKR